MPDLIRTVERGYASSTGRRAGQVSRVHVIREQDGPRCRSHVEGKKSTWCGQSASDHQDSGPIVREAPHPLPEGLQWCPHCIGRLAEHLGMLGEVARLIGAEADP